MVVPKVGRKRKSPIWDYFEYDCMLDESKCLAVEGVEICGQFIKGKIPTNLKVHFRSAHKEANLAYLNKVKDNAKPSFPKTEAKPGTGLSSMTETCRTENTTAVLSPANR